MLVIGSAVVSLMLIAMSFWVMAEDVLHYRHRIIAALNFDPRDLDRKVVRPAEPRHHPVPETHRPLALAA